MNTIKSFIVDLRKGHGARILMLVLGCLLLVYPGTAQDTIALIIAAAFVVKGVAKILSCFAKPKETELGLMEYNSKSNIVVGIIYIIFAAIVPKFLLALIPVIIGIILIVNGIVKVQYALSLKNELGASQGNFMLVSSLLVIILGVVIVLNPFGANNMVIRLIGAFLVFSSIVDLIAYFKCVR